jgi:hypothetical protein
MGNAIGIAMDSAPAKRRGRGVVSVADTAGRGGADHGVSTPVENPAREQAAADARDDRHREPPGGPGQ